MGTNREAKTFYNGTAAIKPTKGMVGFSLFWFVLVLVIGKIGKIGKIGRCQVSGVISQCQVPLFLLLFS